MEPIEGGDDVRQSDEADSARAPESELPQRSESERPERPERQERQERHDRREPEPARNRDAASGPKGSAISEAIDQVSEVIEELKHSLDTMEEVLETLELADRQKIEDEREIQSLQRALRQLHHRGPPRDAAPPR